MSQLTTHILDTSKGKPAAGVRVTLFEQSGESWKEMTSATTNSDGRIPDFLQEDVKLSGIYKIKFHSKEYFDNDSVETFYPFIEIIFLIKNMNHYHVPLLLNPFGYSTYRGS